MIFDRVGAKEESILNLAPLIDVMFQLILFFMLTSNLNENYTIDIEPPSVSNQNSAVSDTNNPTIVISKDNQYLFDSKPMNFKQLTAQIDSYYSAKRKPVSVLADKDSALWPTIELLNYCQEKRYKVQYLVNKSE